MAPDKMPGDQRDINSLEYWFAPTFLPIAQVQAEKIREFQWKDDDVVVVTLPRSGTHLTWMITRMLMQGSVDPILDPMEDSMVWLPAFKDAQKGRRVLNTHIGARDVDDWVLKGRNRKFIYVSRNCKDVSVSQFNFFKKMKVWSEAVLSDNWEEYLPRFYNFIPESIPTDGIVDILDNLHIEYDTGVDDEGRTIPVILSRCHWVSHVRSWENYAARNTDASILFLQFENILRHPDRVIRKIAAFLSLPLSGELLEQIIIACKFDNMKKAPVTQQMTEFWTNGPVSTFYRKGVIGDWKNWYTVAQNEFADAFLAKDMKGSTIVPILCE